MLNKYSQENYFLFIPKFMLKSSQEHIKILSYLSHYFYIMYMLLISLNLFKTCNKIKQNYTHLLLINITF